MIAQQVECILYVCKALNLIPSTMDSTKGTTVDNGSGSMVYFHLNLSLSFILSKFIELKAELIWK